MVRPATFLGSGVTRPAKKNHWGVYYWNIMYVFWVAQPTAGKWTTFGSSYSAVIHGLCCCLLGTFRKSICFCTAWFLTPTPSFHFKSRLLRHLALEEAPLAQYALTGWPVFNVVYDG